MTVEIVTIGDEVLSGFIVNGNARTLGELLTRAGHRVAWASTVGDVETEIISSFKHAAQRAAAVIVTGGLGPTKDDLTRFAVADLLECGLNLHAESLEKIERRFRERGLKLPESNRVQAEIPEKAETIPNPIGTAPGIYFLYQQTHFFLLPGVPKEMEAMLNRTVLPKLKAGSDGLVFSDLLLKTANISESALQDRVVGFQDSFPDVKLAFLPRLFGITLRLMIFGESQEFCEGRLKEGEHYLRERADDVIFASGNDEIEDAVGKILIEKKKKLAVAESCTGGLIGHKLTQVAGSSAYFERGFITYSNEAKMELLSVPEKVIQQFGAVSRETAEAMARGARQHSDADIGLSVTGIAGPGGGSEEKPVGTVCIGFSDSESTMSESFRFFRDRNFNKERFAIAALDLLRRSLLQKD